MSDGQTHYRYFKMGYWVSVPVALFTSVVEPYIGAGILVGYSSGRYLDPDWDLMGTNMAEGRMVNELPVLGHYLFGVSSVYGSIFRKYHRKPITHWPGLSTAIRMLFVYTYPMSLIDSWGVYLFGDNSLKFYFGYWIGLSMADTIHFILDKLEL